MKTIEETTENFKLLADYIGLRVEHCSLSREIMGDRAYGEYGDYMDKCLDKLKHDIEKLSKVIKLWLESKGVDEDTIKRILDEYGSTPYEYFDDIKLDNR